MSSEPRGASGGQVILEVDRISKTYRQYRKPAHRLLEDLSLGRTRKRYREKRVLRDICLSARRGECLGILGRNGSGKSTLLGIISGTILPSSGVVRRRGRLSALLELGTAFHLDVSGRENIYHYANALQIPRADIERRMDRIIEYTELDADIDYPLRSYSTGMVARLAFAVACSVDPDLFVVDEALAVGDIAFRHKALSTIQRIRDQGATILFVTHNPAQVIGLADRALVLEQGEILADGSPADVVPLYQRMMLAGSATAAPAAAAPPPSSIETRLSQGAVRYGRGGGRVLGVGLYERDEGALYRGGRVTVRVSFRADDRIEHPNLGFLLKNEQGVVITGWNLQMSGVFLPPMEKGQLHTAEFDVQLPQLERNSYSLHVTLADGLGRDGLYVDSVEQAYVFQASHGDEVYGVIGTPVEVRIS